MHKFEISENLEQILVRILKKDKILYEQIRKKISEIVNSEDIEHYKNLKYNMKDCKRVHIGHFVLVFRFDKTNNTIIFDDFDHHDKIYLY
jgi:YafQ family addiction module toxin component